MMYFISGDIKIISEFDFEETAEIIAKALQIPPFKLDLSGRWEEEEVFTSRCFGLEFMLCVPDSADKGEYGLSVDSRVDSLYYDGNEQEVDLASYVSALINRTNEVHAIPD